MRLGWLAAVLVLLAGCSRDLDVPPLVPDVAAPAVDESRLAILRNPLGTDDAVSGRAGSVVDRSAPVTVRIWAAAAGGTVLAEGEVAADGSFGPVAIPSTAGTSLATLAPARLWLSAEDGKGNVSGRTEISAGAGATGPAVVNAAVRIERLPLGVPDAVAGDAGALVGGCAPVQVQVYAAPAGAAIATGDARGDRGFDPLPVGSAAGSYPTVWIAATDKCGVTGPAGRAGVGDDFAAPAIDGLAATYHLNLSGNEYDPDPEVVTSVGAAVGDANAVRELRILDADATTVLQRLVPAADGSFPARVSLGQLDAPRIHVSATDKAGNVTPPTLVRSVVESQTAYRRLRSRPGAAPVAGFSIPTAVAPSASFPGLVVGLGGEMDDLTYPGLWTPYTVSATTNGTVQAAEAAGWSLSGVAAPPPRLGAALAYASTSGVSVLFGGSASSSGVCGPAQEYCNDVWLYDGSSWTSVTPLGQWPDPRAHHGVAFDTVRGRLVMFGGNNSASAFPSSADCDATPLTADCGGTWEFDPAARTWAWRVQNDSTGLKAPLARMLHAMAYDPVRGRVVLFGGSAQGVCRGRAFDARVTCGDTWEWDGATWTSIVPATAPSARYGAAMAWHSGLGKVVLFGGYGGTGCDGSATATCGGTYAWDGADWTTLTPASSPSPRNRPAMALDPVRGRLMMVGGWGDPGCDGPVDAGRPNCCGKLWEFDGTTWFDAGLAAAVDVATRLSPVAYDTGRRRLVRYAGNYCDNVVHSFSSATWERTAATAGGPQWAVQAYATTVPEGAALASMRIRHTGTGQGGVAGALGYGVTLYVWDVLLGRWQLVGTQTSSSGGALEAVFTGGQLASFVGAGGRVWLMAHAPQTGAGYASQLFTNHVLVELRYTLP